MSAEEVKVAEASEGAEQPSRARVQAMAVLAAGLALPAFLLWSWSRPIPAPPTEMPPLTLTPAAVDRARAAARALAARSPDSEPARERQRLFRESNAAEYAANDTPGQARLRREALHRALHTVVSEEGTESIAAMRAADVEQGMQALTTDLPGTEGVERLGAFLSMMDRYGMASNGHQTAPDFVIRTALMARWNAIHARTLTEGFWRVHRRAYYGWFALHAATAPLERRLEALDSYREAGGERALEARAVLALDRGDLAGARVAFERASAARGSFRLRNHALVATP